MCIDVRWTTGDRLLIPWPNKCLGVQGKNVGSEVSLYDCDESSDLQKWECKNGTVLALKGQDLHIDLTADKTAVLSGTIGPNSHLTITGTSQGPCTRTYRGIVLNTTTQHLATYKTLLSFLIPNQELVCKFFVNLYII